MELGLRHAAELLAAFIADHGAGDFAFLEGGGLDGGVGFVCVGGGGNFVEGFVLVVFEPLEGALYYCFKSVLWIYRSGKADLHPPVFLTAISARAFSKPMSMSTSKSPAMML